MEVGKAIKIISLVLVTFLVSLMILELAIRTYSVFFFPRMMRFDETLGWSHTPNAEKVFVNEYGEHSLVIQNKFGLRGEPYPLEKTYNKYRILVVGDSFTEGAQVGEEDLFTRLMEQANENLEVLNAGVGSYGTVQQYIYVKTKGLKFNPDLVLLMFYANDLSENCLSYSPAMGPRPYAIDEGNSIRIVERLDDSDYLRFALPAPFPMVLHRYSLLYLFLNTRVYQLLFAEKLKKLHKEYLKSIRINCRGAEVFFDLIRRLNTLVKQNNAEFSVVLIPRAEDLVNGYSESDIDQEISSYLEENGIKYLGLLEALTTESAAGEAPYFEKDIHWTKIGHRIAAQQILEFLGPQLGRNARDGHN